MNAKEKFEQLAARKKTEPFETIDNSIPFSKSIEEHLTNQTSLLPKTTDGNAAVSFARRIDDDVDVMEARSNSPKLRFSLPQELQKLSDNRAGRLASSRLLASRERSLKFNDPEDALIENMIKRIVSSTLLEVSREGERDDFIARGRSGNIELPSSAGPDLQLNEVDVGLELAPEDSTEHLRGGTF